MLDLPNSLDPTPMKISDAVNTEHYRFGMINLPTSFDPSSIKLELPESIDNVLTKIELPISFDPSRLDFPVKFELPPIHLDVPSFFDPAAISLSLANAFDPAIIGLPISIAPALLMLVGMTLSISMAGTPSSVVDEYQYAYDHPLKKPSSNAVAATNVVTVQVEPELASSLTIEDMMSTAQGISFEEKLLDDLEQQALAYEIENIATGAAEIMENADGMMPSDGMMFSVGMMLSARSVDSNHQSSTALLRPVLESESIVLKVLALSFHGVFTQLKRIKRLADPAQSSGDNTASKASVSPTETKTKSFILKAVNLTRRGIQKFKWCTEKKGDSLRTALR
jgi:hypothetical protein